MLNHFELIYKGKEDVFDITVDEVHAFSCNGIIIPIVVARSQHGEFATWTY